ncbi:MAG: aspartyl protease family protein [Phycisphaerae bacterium]
MSALAIWMTMMIAGAPATSAQDSVSAQAAPTTQPSGAERPWKQRLADALEQLDKAESVSAFRGALEAAYRADDWQAGLRLVRLAREKLADQTAIRGEIARALWRGGRMSEASRLVGALPIESADAVTLRAIAGVALAKGDRQRGKAAVARLAGLPGASGYDLYLKAALPLEEGSVEGVAEGLDRAAKLLDARNGYPEPNVIDATSGLAEFFRQIGGEPINRMQALGVASFTVAPLIRLLLVETTINGQGPYRLILDTGGSVLLSLDSGVADEIGVKSLASANIRGAAGKEQSGQALVDELRLGSISMRRVLTRTYPISQRVGYAADGVLGAGLFERHRMTLDYQQMRLIVAESSTTAARGVEVPICVIGDGKIFAELSVNDRDASALFDSGADVVAMSPLRLRELDPDFNPPTFSGAGMAVGEEKGLSVSLSRGVTFELAGRNFEKYGVIGLDALDAQVGPLLGVQADMLVGMALLRQAATWTVDYPRRKMWLEWLPESNSRESPGAKLGASEPRP